MQVFMTSALQNDFIELKMRQKRSLYKVIMDLRKFSDVQQYAVLG